MELKLNKINCYGDNNSMIFLSIVAEYGWEGKMCSDIIKLNYNGKKREAFLTVKIQNSGVGLIIERIIEILNDIFNKNDKKDNQIKKIIEKMSENFKFKYNRESVEDTIKQYNII